MKIPVIHFLFLIAVVALWIDDGRASSLDSASETARANTRFATSLYRQLDKENPGENLFFSPCSVFSSLAMAVEGARGETAIQIGEAMGLPRSFRKAEDNRIPWNTDRLHTELSAIRRSLSGDNDTPEARAARERITQLRAELAILHRWCESQPSGTIQWKAADRERELIAELDRQRAKVDRYEFVSSGSIWVEKSFPFNQAFLCTVRKQYGPGSVYAVDFKGRHARAREEINRIVARQTGGRITGAVGPGDIDAQTRVVLTAAVFFRSEWSEPFDRRKTRDREFTLADGQKLNVPIMSNISKRFAYAAFNGEGSPHDTPDMIPAEHLPIQSADAFSEDPAVVAKYNAKIRQHKERVAVAHAKCYPDESGFAMVALPYKGERLDLIALAPRDPARLSAIESLLSADNLRSWIGHLKRREVKVELPRLSLDTSYILGRGAMTSAYNNPTECVTAGPLPAMGMKRAFMGGHDPFVAAQFDGMAPNWNEAVGRLYLTQVLHKARLEINEKGTEATAATIMTADPFGELPPPVMIPFVPTFTADRPFLFLIRDNETGMVLFLGRCMRPSG